MTRHNAHDEMWGKDTIIIQTASGNYYIKGNDGEMYTIDPCTAQYYIIKFEEMR